MTEQGYREMNLVMFACTKDDKPKHYALDDKEYDVWVAGEPQQGYFLFEFIGTVLISLDTFDV